MLDRDAAHQAGHNLLGVVLLGEGEDAVDGDDGDDGRAQGGDAGRKRQPRREPQEQGQRVREVGGESEERASPFGCHRVVRAVRCPPPVRLRVSQPTWGRGEGGEALRRRQSRKPRVVGEPSYLVERWSRGHILPHSAYSVVSRSRNPTSTNPTSTPRKIVAAAEMVVGQRASPESPPFSKREVRGLGGQHQART